MANYSEVIKDDTSLKLFLAKLREFDQHFVNEMVKGSDYTIKLEVRGCKGKVIHVRTNVDAIDRPQNMKDENVRK